MNSFYLGKTKILLSTTVVEVGMDVKNASMIVILNAERFGLAQIHQLRGRVGRGSIKSDCYLISDDLENRRLNIALNCSDGFDISYEDFKLRGPGDYLGDIQSGYNAFNYADFTNDLKIWQCAKEDSCIYCPKLLSNEIENKRFKEIIQLNKNQKGKIN